jgi:hypothetical protein
MLDSAWKGLSGKIKSPIRYLLENPIKFLCQPKDSDNFCFPDLLCFASFSTTYSDNLVTPPRFSANVSVGCHRLKAEIWFGSKFGSDVITPFATFISFKPKGELTDVKIHDSTAIHTVPVTGLGKNSLCK